MGGKYFGACDKTSLKWLSESTRISCSENGKLAKGIFRVRMVQAHLLPVTRSTKQQFLTVYARMNLLVWILWVTQCKSGRIWTICICHAKSIVTCAEITRLLNVRLTTACLMFSLRVLYRAAQTSTACHSLSHQPQWTAYCTEIQPDSCK